ncbi:MAG: NAD(P)/FAD-dependent oxidoreductase [Anaerolineales bacterium]
MSVRHDVAVIGAGPGGSSAASWLAQAGLDVILLDKAEFPRDKTCGDAISPRAVHVLDKLGLTDAVQQAGHPAKGVTVISPAGVRMQTDFPDEPPFGRLAYVITRYQLDHLIQQHAVECGARFRSGFHAANIESNAKGVRVQGKVLHGESSILARVAIVAVGASTPLLHRIGLLPEPVGFSFAARAYFRGLSALDQNIQLRFDGVPLPGYGWIFPLSDDSANVGAGYYRPTPDTPSTPVAALREFLVHPAVQPQFRRAKQIGPVKGFPLRTDFHRSPTFGPRTLLVGEAAGLVNPFTGEGIDYALESGELAAQSILRAFGDGTFGAGRLRAYDRALRRRFQHTFVYTHLLRRVYMNEGLLNPLIRAADRWPTVADRLIRILSSYESPLTAFSPVMIARVLASMRSS